MHFASSLFRILFAKFFFLKFLYGILLVLFRCCFQHVIENSILYRKDIQPFYIGPILFSENKIIQSVVGRKVDVQILFGTRSEKSKILFGARDEKRKNLFGAKWQLRKIVFESQRVKDVLPPAFVTNWSEVAPTLGSFWHWQWTFVVPNEVDNWSIKCLFRLLSFCTIRVFWCLLLSQAVCCDDKQHCCPEGTTCDVAASKCSMGADTVPWSTKTTAKVAIGTSTKLTIGSASHFPSCACKDGQTCCQSVNGIQSGCCTFKNVRTFALFFTLF